MEATRLVQLDTALQLLSQNAVPYAGTVYRILSPLYANTKDAFSGKGSLYASGRFHIKGTFLIVYTGCTEQQAAWEMAHTSRNSGLTRQEVLPLTTLCARVGLGKILDLTDRAVRRQLKVSRQSLSQSAWTTSTGETVAQAIGRLANKYGFEAILTPSAGPGNNFNILPENFNPGSFVQIINEHHLPTPSRKLGKRTRSILGAAVSPKKRSIGPPQP